MKANASQYNLDTQDLPERNVMFDKPWAEVTNDDIRRKAEELRISGPRKFHVKERAPSDGRMIAFNRPIPRALLDWHARAASKW